MRHFVEFDKYGKVSRQCSMTHGDRYLEQFPNSLEIPNALEHLNWYKDAANNLIELPPQPEPFYTWNGYSWEDMRTDIEKNNYRHELINSIRSKRDELLTKSDGYVMKLRDFGEPVPAEWIVYRQALRDLPNQPGVPYDVIWPEKPAN